MCTCVHFAIYESLFMLMCAPMFFIVYVRWMRCMFPLIFHFENIDVNLFMSKAYFFKEVSKTLIRFWISENSFLLKVIFELLPLQTSLYLSNFFFIFSKEMDKSFFSLKAISSLFFGKSFSFFNFLFYAREISYLFCNSSKNYVSSSIIKSLSSKKFLRFTMDAFSPFAMKQTCAASISSSESVSKSSQVVTIVFFFLCMFLEVVAWSDGQSAVRWLVFLQWK